MGCPVPGPVYNGNLGEEGMCVGGLLRVGAEGSKFGFLNPHQPRKQLQERTPHMVLCVCACMSGRPGETERQNCERDRERQRKKEKQREAEVKRYTRQMWLREVRERRQRNAGRGREEGKHIAI